MGGVEVALVFALREAVKRHLEWPSVLMAVLAAALLSAGVARHYWDIYKERTVRGISFTFVGIDALGDLTSLISVFFQPMLDVLGIVIYGSELALWLGVFACGGWFNLRPWVQNMRSGRISQPDSVSGTVQDDSPRENENVVEQRQRLDMDSGATGSVFRTASIQSHNSSQLSEESMSVRLRRLPPV